MQVFWGRVLGVRLYFAVLLVGMMSSASADVVFRYHVHTSADDTSTYRIGKAGASGSGAVNITPVDGYGTYYHDTYTKVKETYSWYNFPYAVELKAPSITLAYSPYTSFPDAARNYDPSYEIQGHSVIEYVDIHYYVGDPKNIIVKWRGINNSEEAVGALVRVDYAFALDAVHNTGFVVPQTATEADVWEITTWINEHDVYSDEPKSAIVEWWQDGEKVAESSSINFIWDELSNAWTSGVHELVYTPPPETKLHLACTAMNGYSLGGTVRATVGTSKDRFEQISMGTVPSGTYYDPSTATVFADFELEDGEYPTYVHYSIVMNGDAIETEKIDIQNKGDGYDYYASGVVNASGIPPKDNPEFPEDADSSDNSDDNTPPDAPDRDPNNRKNPPPPKSDGTNSTPMNYEKLTQAIEFALKNQGVSGSGDSLKKILDASPGGIGVGGFDDSVNTNRVMDIGQEKFTENLRMGGEFSSFLEEWFGSFFTLDLPQSVGTRPTFVIELPDIELPDQVDFLPDRLEVKFDDFKALPLVRMLEAWVLHILGVLAAASIVKGMF